MRSFPLVQYLRVQLICVLLVKARAKVLKFPSFFSSAYALFHFPYPLSPLLATLTRIAGCVPTIPRLELVTRHLSLATLLKFSLFKLLRTLLHASKCQRLCFQAFPHSLRKTPGWGEGLWRTPGASLSGNASSPEDTTRQERWPHDTLPTRSHLPTAVDPHRPPLCAFRPRLGLQGASDGRHARRKTSRSRRQADASRSLAR